MTSPAPAPGSSDAASPPLPLPLPVVVAGNGPVGQTVALLLARHGIPVVLLDGRPGRDAEGSKAICQQRDVLDVWASAGVPQVAEEGLTWTRARTFYRTHELFSVELPDPGASPLPPFVNISQTCTEQLLDARIAREPLVDVRWGHTVEDRQDHPDRVTVRCSTPRGVVDVEGSYLVACGGARGSTLRHALEVTFPGRTFEDAFLICDIRADLPGWETERRFYFDPEWNPGRQVLIHPCPGSVFRIDWQVDPTFELEAARRDGSLDARVRQVVGPGVDYEVVWSSVYRFHARLASRFRSGRALLAGDMAHLVSPFGARGLNSGVGDADNLAWKLAAVLRGWADDSLLDTYEVERMAAARENLEVTTATMDFLVPHTDEARHARHTLLTAAVTDEGARARVDSGRLAEPFWYVDSPLTTPDPERPWPGRPPRGAAPAPVPGIVLPDARLEVEDAAGTGLDAAPTTRHGLRMRDVVRGRVSLLVDSAGAAEEAARVLERVLPAGVPRAAVDLTTLPGARPVMDGLDWQVGDWWLVRPDAHTAARLPGGAGAEQAVARVLGRTEADALDARLPGTRVRG